MRLEMSNRGQLSQRKGYILLLILWTKDDFAFPKVLVSFDSIRGGSPAAGLIYKGAPTCENYLNVERITET